ncbi:oligopeptide/dipeptide ABC transporter ATP-binding protein, partial [Lutispora sp.]|uniref:oligopeptide/dipeptide ABC transporter ATP-binding protein n=1 Tax=Lutispora sp. TaxID=2828727 RepID=UPI0035621875
PRLSSNKTRLVPIPGTPPDLLKPPKGCPFYNRCNFAMNICKEEMPLYYQRGEQKAMCWMLDENAPRVEEYERQKGGVRSGV